MYIEGLNNMDKLDIIKCAIKCFEKKNIKFSMADLTAELNVSRRTLYEYFDSKEDIVNAVVKYIFNDIESTHKRILAEDISSIEKLKKILLVYPSMINLDGYNISKIGELLPSVMKLINSELEANWALTISVFEECKVNKQIGDYDCEVFRMVMLGIYEISMTYQNHHQMLEQSIELLFGGLII